MKSSFLFIMVLSSSILTIFPQANNDNLNLKIVDQNGDFVRNAKLIVRTKDGRVVLENTIVDGQKLVKIPRNQLVVIEVKAEGFQEIVKEVTVYEESKEIMITLRVKTIDEVVSVQMTEREKRFAESTSKIFTQSEIDELPENPEDIKRELQTKYGNDVIFKVDGFTGGQFPTKTQIASISISMTPLDAEYREIGRVVIDIRTKVSVTKNWSGIASYSISDSLFDSRNAFSPFKAPSNVHGFYFSLNPPSINKDTSLQFTINGSRSKSYQYFLLDETTNQEDARTKKVSKLNPEITFKRNLPQSFSLITRYSLNSAQSSNSGLGVLDLFERSINVNSNSHDVRTTINGNLPKELMNQLTVRFINSHSRVLPNSETQTIIVPGEFLSGGAGIRSRISAQSLEIGEIITFGSNKHLFKAGGIVKIESKKYEVGNNLNGRFTFSGLTDFNSEIPLLYEISEGASSFRFSNTQLSAFIQDYFLVGKFIQLGFGVRWDFDSVFNDKNNIAPRASVVWSPEKSGRLIIKAGFGTFYYSTGSDLFTEVYSNNENQPKSIRILYPSYPNPNNGGLSQNTTQTISEFGKLRNPITYNGIIGANYTASKFLTVIAAFGFGRNNYLPRVRDANAPINGIRPNPRFGIIKQTEFAGNLTLYTTRISADFNMKRIDFLVSYANEKNNLDYAPEQLPTNNSDLKLDKGRLDGTRTHSIEITADFKLFSFLPYKPLSSVHVYINSSIQSGKPYNITTGFDNNEDGVINDRPAGTPRNSVNEPWRFQTDLLLNWRPKVFTNQLGKKSVSLSLSIGNLFNHTNKTDYIGVMTSDYFMRPTAAERARNASLRIDFSF